VRERGQACKIFLLHLPFMMALPAAITDVVVGSSASSSSLSTRDLLTHCGSRRKDQEAKRKRRPLGARKGGRTRGSTETDAPWQLARTLACAVSASLPESEWNPNPNPTPALPHRSLDASFAHLMTGDWTRTV